MKTKYFARQAGFGLPTILVLVAGATLILGGAMRWSVTHTGLNARNNELREAEAAAEAACEKVMAHMLYDYKIGGQSQLSNNASTYTSLVPLASEHANWANFEFSNALGTQDESYVRLNASFTYTNMIAPYQGLMGTRAIYRVISNARLKNGRYNVPAGVQQDIWVSSIPVFQFAIFYQGDLENNPASDLTVEGPVHCNGNIWNGPSASSTTVTFEGNVTASGRITHTRHPDDPSYPGGAGTIVYEGTKTTNTPSLTLPIGTNNTPESLLEVIKPPPPGENPNSTMGQERYYNKAELVILATNNVTTTFSNRPVWFAFNTAATNTANIIATNRGTFQRTGTTGTGVGTATWANYFVAASKVPFSTTSNLIAEIGTTNNLLTSHTSNPHNQWYFVKMPLNGVPGNPLVHFITTNHPLPFMVLTNRFIDQREVNKTVRTIDIEISGMRGLDRWSRTNLSMRQTLQTVLNNFSATNTNIPVRLVYISDRRTYNLSANLWAVRLTNAVSLGSRGLTIATENPLYTDGNFNTSANSWNFNTTTWWPASLVSDSLTILSSNWRDALNISGGDFEDRNAVDTIINAATLTGIVPTSSTHYSGGVHNYPRLLEDWNGPGASLTLRGSMVALWHSAKATNDYVNINRSDSYYSQPERNYLFDTRFTQYGNLPPGTPESKVLIVDRFYPAPANTTNYAVSYH